MMFDRVATSQGRPQRFGTQFRCDGGKWRPYPIEHPDHLEERRKAEAFPGTFAEMQAYFDQLPPCPRPDRRRHRECRSRTLPLREGG